MAQSLQYGAGCTLELDLPADTLLANCWRPEAQPLDDPAAAVAAALADPLNFPPLARATVAGDRIAVTLEPGLPQVAALVAGVVHALLEAGSQPDEISVVQSAAEAEIPGRDPLSLLAADLRDHVRLVRHDPRDPTALAYLAASKWGDPIYVNRAICDADVVLPIGSFRLDPASGRAGMHAALFPTFSDERAQQRYGQQSWPSDPTGEARRREELQEAIWLLGAQFAVLVIPGHGDSVLHILAGDADTVATRGQAMCEAAWRFEVPRRASLVVATIDGDQQQTWDNFVRALVAASNVVTDDGAVVICSQLRQLPKPAQQPVAAPTAAPPSQGPASPHAPSPALPSRRAGRVYLLSHLDGDVVEQMGLGHVTQTEEITRLSRQHDSCILVPSAQHAVVVARGE